MKLENILIDQDGYIKLTDFGLSKEINKFEMANSFCGTQDYLSPQIVKGEYYDKNVDWWALGIILYELLIGKSPFFSSNINKMCEKICKNDPAFPDRKKYKVDYSNELMDLICQLLNKNPKKRLGANNDYIEILQHPFFEGVDIEAYENKQIVPPFNPNSNEIDYTDNQSLSKDLANVFNIRNDLRESEIPVYQQQIVEENQEIFKNFETRS